MRKSIFLAAFCLPTPCAVGFHNHEIHRNASKMGSLRRGGKGGKGSQGSNRRKGNKRDKLQETERMSPKGNDNSKGGRETPKPPRGGGRQKKRNRTGSPSSTSDGKGKGGELSTPSGKGGKGGGEGDTPSPPPLGKRSKGGKGGKGDMPPSGSPETCHCPCPLPPTSIPASTSPTISPSGKGGTGKGGKGGMPSPSPSAKGGKGGGKQGMPSPSPPGKGGGKGDMSSPAPSGKGGKGGGKQGLPSPSPSGKGGVKGDMPSPSGKGGKGGGKQGMPSPSGNGGKGDGKQGMPSPLPSGKGGGKGDMPSPLPSGKRSKCGKGHMSSGSPGSCPCPCPQPPNVTPSTSPTIFPTPPLPCVPPPRFFISDGTVSISSESVEPAPELSNPCEDSCYWATDSEPEAETFVYKNISSNQFTVRSRICSVGQCDPTNSTDVCGKMGLMVRESLDADAPFFSCAMEPFRELNYCYRTEVGGNTSCGLLNLEPVDDCMFLVLDRDEDSFTFKIDYETDTDCGTCCEFCGDRVNICEESFDLFGLEMGKAVHYGMFVDSTGRDQTVTFRNSTRGEFRDIDLTRFDMP